MNLYVRIYVQTSEVILLDALMPFLLCPGNALYCGDANKHAKFAQYYTCMYVHTYFSLKILENDHMGVGRLSYSF